MNSLRVYPIDFCDTFWDSWKYGLPVPEIDRIFVNKDLREKFFF